MQLHCPRCGNPIPGADLDLARGVGVCRPCGEIVALPSGPAQTAPPERGLARPYKPETLRYDERLEDGVYRASVAPNRLAAVPLLGFAALWDGFLAFWYAQAFRTQALGMGLFTVLHLGAGIFITHRALVTLLNTRHVSIGRERVRITNGPIPAGGRLDRGIDEIDGFVLADTSTSKSVSFAVRVNLADGSSKKLDLGPSDRPACDYVVASLNDALARAKTREPAETVPYRG